MIVRPAAALRYQEVGDVKTTGATYTPALLSDFVATQIVRSASLDPTTREPLRILDPAIGDGELVLSLLRHVAMCTSRRTVVTGFDTDPGALKRSAFRISAEFPEVELELRHASFLDYVLAQPNEGPSLFDVPKEHEFDLIIANPPYVRTQVIGGPQAQKLANTFGLTGRVDLYQAFLIGMTQALGPRGTAGVIVSNRFMTTKGAAGLRRVLRTKWSLQDVWDLGDTKLFDAAVLPAVIVARGQATSQPTEVGFRSIYETKEPAEFHATDPVAALDYDGQVSLPDGRVFKVQHGTLSTGPSLEDTWRIATDHVDTWLATVASKTWRTFGDLGKTRVGVKTCADKVFIRHDWEGIAQQPELLRRLTTHHVAGRYRANEGGKWRHILYPHEVRQGVRSPVELDAHPNARDYLNEHRTTLEARSYVIEAGRRWYEIWVPQDPAAWDRPKLIFRDISERPTFWVDLDGTVVNGDCYWLTTNDPREDELLWLAAAVANSTFAEAFYDHRFNNKLYGGRRRFITQYVEQFPLPDPTTELGREIATSARALYDAAGPSDVSPEEAVLDALVWKAFGF